MKLSTRLKRINPDWQVRVGERVGGIPSNFTLSQYYQRALGYVGQELADKHLDFTTRDGICFSHLITHPTEFIEVDTSPTETITYEVWGDAIMVSVIRISGKLYMVDQYYYSAVSGFRTYRLNYDPNFMAKAF